MLQGILARLPIARCESGHPFRGENGAFQNNVSGMRAAVNLDLRHALSKFTSSLLHVEPSGFLRRGGTPLVDIRNMALKYVSGTAHTRKSHTGPQEDTKHRTTENVCGQLRIS